MQVAKRIWRGLWMRKDQNLREPGAAAFQGRTHAAKGKPKGSNTRGKNIKGMTLTRMWTYIIART